MKKSNDKSKFRIKRVNESIYDDDFLSDEQIEKICSETDLCDANPRKKYEIIDLEVLYERVHSMRVELERNKGTILWFERECSVLESEILRIEEKIILLET